MLEHYRLTWDKNVLTGSFLKETGENTGHEVVKDIAEQAENLRNDVSDYHQGALKFTGKISVAGMACLTDVLAPIVKAIAVYDPKERNGNGGFIISTSRSPDYTVSELLEEDTEEEVMNLDQ